MPESFEIGAKVRSIDNDQTERSYSIIHHGTCNECGYDRILVNVLPFPGIQVAVCQNPACENKEEV